jgi:hypothetical protein
MSNRSRHWKFTGNRTLLIAAAVFGAATTGAAAAGHTPWSGVPRPALAAESGAHADSGTHGGTGAGTDTFGADALEDRDHGGDPPTTTAGMPATSVVPAPGVVQHGDGPAPGPADGPVTDEVIVASQSQPGFEPATTAAPATTVVSATVEVPKPTEVPETTSAPAPPSTTPPPTSPKNDSVVPQTLGLACTLDGDASANTVSCSWSGGAVAGFVRYLVLRGNAGGKGRVPFSSTDPAASSFEDSGLAAGQYSYVVVELDSSDKALSHSNPVSIVIPPAGG